MMKQCRSRKFLRRAPDESPLPKPHRDGLFGGLGLIISRRPRLLRTGLRLDAQNLGRCSGQVCHPNYRSPETLQLFRCLKETLESILAINHDLDRCIPNSQDLAEIGRASCRERVWKDW